MSTTVELGRMRDQRDAAVAELDKLRAGVRELADVAAHSSCIHLNDMFGQLSRLLGADS